MSEFALVDPTPTVPRVPRQFWLARVRVPNELVLPAGIVADARDLVFAHDLVLRSEPFENDAYDGNRSGFLEAAVFGTTIHKFLPGVTAHQLGTFTDAAGQRFALVRIDRGAGSKAYYSALPSDVGWVRVDMPR